MIKADIKSTAPYSESECISTLFQVAEALSGPSGEDPLQKAVQILIGPKRK